MTSMNASPVVGGQPRKVRTNRDFEREAMRLAVYIREIGAEPVALRGKDYRGWERNLQRQYQQLRETLGRDAGQAARVRGRGIIRNRGLSGAAADLQPVAMRPGRKTIAGPEDTIDETPAQRAAAETAEGTAISARFDVSPNPSVCKRKYRHVNFLSAILHAQRIDSPGLDVYPCELCGGLHVGHNPNNPETQRTRFIRKRLRSIDRQLAAMDRQASELRREWHALQAEKRGGNGLERGRLWQYLSRAKAWLRKR